MSKIDIKDGETYYVRVKVTEKIDNKIITQTVSANGSALIVSPTIFFSEEAPAFSHVLPTASIEFFKTNVIPEAYPKYAPCREFRKGDIVRPRSRDGREPWGRTITSVRCLNKSRTLNVSEDEARGIVKCEDEDGLIFDISPFFLELITPIEAMEPYFVQEGERSTGWGVWKRNNANSTCSLMASYSSAHPKSKAAAEAECARLNAERRKEQA